MSRKTYLYRAVTTISIPVYHNGEAEPTLEKPGYVIGRQTGYLSRSSAVDAARRARFDACEFEVIRSEPVVFLDEKGRIEKQIDALYARLVELEQEQVSA